MQATLTDDRVIIDTIMIDTLDPSLNFIPIPGYYAVYPEATEDMLRPAIERRGAVHHITVKHIPDIEYTVNDGIHTRSACTLLRNELLCIQVDINYIGFWEGKRLQMFRYLYWYDASRDEFTPTTQAEAEGRGYKFITASEESQEGEL